MRIAMRIAMRSAMRIAMLTQTPDSICMQLMDQRRCDCAGH